MLRMSSITLHILYATIFIELRTAFLTGPVKNCPVRLLNSETELGFRKLFRNCSK